MKKTKLALAISSAVFASSAMATNGTNMTGVGAQSSAMGGTGVAAYYGAENVIVNPAMIGKSTGTEFSFGGTLFQPTVSNNGMNPAAGFADSTADTFVIPSVSLVSRINDTLTFGIGMYGTSGMGVDYSDSANNAVAQSQLQIMRIVPTIAYNKDNFSVGFSPIIQYGALDINFDTGAGQSFGRGASSNLGLGYSVGASFDASEDVVIGATYTSAIDMDYKGQLSGAGVQFGMTIADNLEQPAELKLGLAFNKGNMKYTIDAQQIKWGEAKGYKDFGWQDQNVIAIGAKYQGNGYWLGLGYNKGDNPVVAQSGTTSATAAINFLNNLFFPATTEQHFSLGAGYNLTKNVALDFAAVIAPEVETTVNITGLGMATNTTKHSQNAYTVSVRYNF